MVQTSFVRNRKSLDQVISIRENDENALKELYQNNYSKIESFILNNNGTEEQAKDIFQDAFIAVWRNLQLDRFHPENETAIDGYLYQIAKNKWMDHLRSGYHKKIVPMNETIHQENEQEVYEEENEYLIAVRKHFKDLGENCQLVLTKFYFGNEPLKKIAETMGWTEATARNNKYRCIQKLRELINKK